MPGRAEIVAFDDSPPPPGADPWVPGAAPAIGVEVTGPDPAWPRQYDDLAGRIRKVLGWRCNLHVFGFDSPELVRHRIFRDWLRGNPEERDRYAATKRQAASEANAGGEHVMQYNARKQQVIREIYHRAFVTAGLLEE
jgi:GrpB-like predicted nucleotidyltransferase (UPF0157 family)